ncbi:MULTISPECIES: hypothetical protein [unclassified Halorubrum]|uniref:hypothetical protein n=1 Tax=unclassified Halorubrum TaxID=2642239 RepID=UPI00130547C5|nr:MULTISPECIES: hypothetical protein [unclassified Halorubrum]
MSDYTREPNENWLQENQGETVLLQFPHAEYVVTVYDDTETAKMLNEADGGVPADD